MKKGKATKFFCTECNYPIEIRKVDADITHLWDRAIRASSNECTVLTQRLPHRTGGYAADDV